MECERIHPLLAGYVDRELSDLERQAVEQHVSECADCRALLDEQRAAADAYRKYPVAEPTQANWDRVWSGVEARLPARAKRVSLETLSDSGTIDRLLSEEEAVEEALASPPPEPFPEVPAQPAEEVREKPVRFSDLPPEEEPLEAVPPARHRYLLWAHLAGTAAAALLAVAALLGVDADVGPEHLADVDEVEIEYDVTAANAPMLIMLSSERGGDIPMIWVAGVPDEESVPRQEATQ